MSLFRAIKSLFARPRSATPGNSPAPEPCRCGGTQTVQVSCPSCDGSGAVFGETCYLCQGNKTIDGDCSCKSPKAK